MKRATGPAECRAYRLAHKKELAEYRKRVRAAESDKYKAQACVNNALRGGRLNRQPCWVCGAVAQAHHASYAQDMRLDVTWLCRDHHAQVHREANAYS